METNKVDIGQDSPIVTKSKKISKIITTTALIVVAIIFSAAYSYYPAASIKDGAIKFTSPDETAAYYFAVQFAQTSNLTVEESLLSDNGNHIHPRSVTEAKGRLAPVGFVGGPIIYGSIAKVFGVGVIPFITPILAGIAGIFFYQLIRRIFDKRTGLVAVALLWTHPAYWYNASRSMLPNVPFLSLEIIGFSLIFIAHDKKTNPSRIEKVIPYFLALLGGISLGMALTIRFSESLWIGGLLALLALVSIRRLRWLLALMFIVGMAMPLGVFLSVNQAIYGSALAGGYGLSAASGFTGQFIQAGNLASSGKLTEIFTYIRSLPSTIWSYTELLLPFGYRPKEFLQNGRDYLVDMFWWYIIPCAAGVLYAVVEGIKALVRKKMPVHLLYSLVVIAISIWLTVFYGSWVFYDNISGETTLGNSYIRYWLPIYTMAMPLVAYGLIKVGEKRGAWGRSATVAIIACMAIYGVQTVLVTNKESLIPTAKVIQTYHETGKKVFDLTPPDAVIVSSRSDKIFFPQRKVAVSFDFAELDLMIPVAMTGKVYYYGLWGEKDGAYLSKKYFEPRGLRMIYIGAIYNNEHLYHVESL